MTKIFLSALTLLFTFIVYSSKAQNPNTSGISIIPWPQEVQVGKGHFVLNKNTVIVVPKNNADALRIAQMLADKLKKAAGITLPIRQENLSDRKNSIIFGLNAGATDLGKEGYKLSVSKQRAQLNANEAAGLFYGLQTIYQLLPAEIESETVMKGIKWLIPGVEIKDVPRFGWRGMHLDVSRHMFSVEFIKKYIDNMAMHKLNTFHWHLTDDQGWRLEIKKYPKLTEIGGWRKETLIGHVAIDTPHRFDGKPYGGYYTQEQAKEIVAYAKDRFITVIPEIDMPGHATAAIAAYPELGDTGKQIDVETYWGVFSNLFNVREETFGFLEDVLTEVMAIFPAEYIHIGGDEAAKDGWKKSAEIQQKIKELGLKDEHELQSYFIKRMERFINAKGRKMIGWYEILEGGLAPNATVMSWQGVEGGILAAKSKHDVIMTPIQHLYFWFYQGNRKTEPLAGDGYLPLEKVYRYEPVPPQLKPEETKYILGAQACAWTEYMPDESTVEYMVFPRISALSEVVWSPKEVKDWKGFTDRLGKQYKRYDYRKINYAKIPFDIGLEEPK